VIQRLSDEGGREGEFDTGLSGGKGWWVKFRRTEIFTLMLETELGLDYSSGFTASKIL